MLLSLADDRVDCLKRPGLGENKCGLWEIMGERIETMGKTLEQHLQELREMLLVAVSQADDAHNMATDNPYGVETA
jgi:hypothetical protein